MSASLRRIWIQITADRKRFGVLCATFGVGLLLWARLIIVSNVSRTAMADGGPGATAAAAAASQTPEAGKPVKGAADKPAGKDAAKAPTKQRQTVEVRLFSHCERDPFVISPLYFPKAKTGSEVKQEAGKLSTEPAEDATQKEARLVARLGELLGSFRLEAVMGNSMAIISGRRYAVGDRLPVNKGSDSAEFMLVEVRQRSVVLESQGRRFEMEMSTPGSPTQPGS